MTRRSASPTPDKHDLYQQSVQNAEFETKFLRRAYVQCRGRSPIRLREDFCGTALFSCEWVRRYAGNQAVGVDLDPKVLEWGRRHNRSKLGSRAKDVQLIEGNVLSPPSFHPDIVAALNFSYFVFKTRAELKRYFLSVRGSLAEDGVFVLDLYGGPEAQVIQEESTRYDGFTYVWDQARFNPISGEILCHIHFDLPGRKRMRRAFTYDWRLWSLPEVQDLLFEVGFDAVDVYWEGTDKKTLGGNGVYRRSLKGDNARSFVAYLVAAK